MNFPVELEDKATSLRKETLRELERGELLQLILKEFDKQYQRFLENEDLEFLQEDYNAMLINRGREVMVLEPGKEYLAKALGINKLGELLVRKEDGSTEEVFAGEVSVRGIYGYV
jgi:BirA family biotin operon repressor/biotin-[acetyl-CoA-carboxylase] ligase